LGPDAFWTEPAARGTAPVLTWAAWRIQKADPLGVMVSLHSDHVIRPLGAFRELILEAAQVVAREDLLLTVGAAPDRPEVGFGYLEPGEALEVSGDLRGYRVERFHEKPELETARSYLARGYLWNTGLFVWRAATFLSEVERHAPELGRLLPLLERGDEAGFFAAAPQTSVDEAVLERSGRVGVLQANFEWDDLGSWEALARTLAPDALGNVALGPVHVLDGSDNVVFAEGAPVVLFGVSDLVVVRTAAATLVVPRILSAELKALLERLPESLRRLD
jgi:mannose-1-phosphate guanylyltransferase